MTTTPVSYELDGEIATITMDDGKRNAQSLPMMEALLAALDRAEADDAVVVLRGNAGTFSAGFDLATFQSGDGEAVFAMLRAGGEVVARLLSFPRPVVAASTGHGIAQGAFLLLACDVRFGLSGSFRFGMNETAIGLVVPDYAVEVCRHRMPAPAFDRALGTGPLVDAATAREWGILDVVLDSTQELDEAVATEAARLATLVPAARTGTVARVRGDLAQRCRDLVAAEFPVGGAS